MYLSFSNQNTFNYGKTRIRNTSWKKRETHLLARLKKVGKTQRLGFKNYPLIFAIFGSELRGIVRTQICRVSQKRLL